MAAREKPSLSKSSLLESIIKSQPGLYVLFDQNGSIHWWNTRLEYYTGYLSEEIENLKIFDFVDETDQ
ncbi:MAG: PAS domain S-box protein [Balneolales bacterium]